MPSLELIPIDIFCQHHGVAISFVSSLNDFGLIELTVVDQSEYIPLPQLREVEKLVRLHTDLDINLEGINAVSHLLKLLHQSQIEIAALNNKLRFYEVIE